MIKKLILGLMFIGLTSNSFASSTTDAAWKNINVHRDATINFYGIDAKTQTKQKSSSGVGVMFDSEAIKVKLERTSNFIKTGAVLKFNPFIQDLYFKLGADYINQKMYAPDNTSARVNQYSTAAAMGYMLGDDFYSELGGSYTKLNGKVFGNYEIKNETTTLTYLEMAKRWNNSLGTIDTTANVGQVSNSYVNNNFSYGLGIDYYPTNNARLSYAYQNEQNNIISSYSAQYSFFFAKYIDNLSLNTYQVNAGIKIAFNDLFHISTWRAPRRIKPHLSELHKFETITFSTNMNIQSTVGVEKTAAAIARDRLPNKPAISTPTIKMANRIVNIPANDPNIFSYAPLITGVDTNAVYSITPSTNSAYIVFNTSTGGIFIANLLPGTYSLTIKVVNPDGGHASTLFTIIAQ